MSQIQGQLQWQVQVSQQNDLIEGNLMKTMAMNYNTVMASFVLVVFGEWLII